MLDAHFGECDDGEGLEARGRREGARRRLRRLRLRTGDGDGRVIGLIREWCFEVLSIFS